jgi:hypothetical protein
MFAVTIIATPEFHLAYLFCVNMQFLPTKEMTGLQCSFFLLLSTTQTGTQSHPA